MNAARVAHIVGVDSMTLVWGIRQNGPDEKIKHARWLFQSLDEEGAQIVVSSVTLAEYLVPFPPHTHNDVISPLAKRFIIAPFDAKCAALAARLFAEGKEEREMGVPNARNLLRADSLIIATCAVHGARVFYTDDGDCRSLAKRARLGAEPLPTIAPDLFSQ